MSDILFNGLFMYLMNFIVIQNKKKIGLKTCRISAEYERKTRFYLLNIIN